MNNLIFDPLEEYRDNFKAKHNDNVNSLFDELLIKSGVNVADNDATVSRINLLNKKIAEHQKVLNKARSRKGFLIFLTVISFIASFIFFFFFFTKDPALPMADNLKIMLGILTLVLGIIIIVITVKVIDPKIKEARNIIYDLTNEKDAKVKEAWAQVALLNDLFEDSMSAKLVEKTVPLLTMDHLFDSKRFDYLNRKYGLSALTSINESALFVQSGMIQGNPFLLSRSLYMDMGTKTYTGSITVTYTVTVYVDNKPQTQTRSETLTASVTKPCPYYSNDTIIVYGNEAAPNLSFNRTPVLPLSWNKNTLAKIVKDGEKNMRKLTAEGLKKGKQFTPLGNSEFEALFQAYNRDNEMEYRLLFTALGQSEISDLIKDKTVGFGDDFEFHKAKNINIIRSRHSQGFDYSGNVNNYLHYDNKTVRHKFVTYNNNYLRYFYFNMAPILAVPLYQQHKPQEFIYQQEYQSFLSFYEHEATANSFPSSSFAHKESRTQNILKTTLLSKGSDNDVVKVSSHGFKTVDRVDYIMKTAGNGTSHRVPVHWVEYIPVQNDSVINIKVLDEEVEKKVKATSFTDAFQKELSKYTNNQALIQGKHVMAFMLIGKYNESNNEAINAILNQKK